MKLGGRQAGRTGQRALADPTGHGWGNALLQPSRTEPYRPRVGKTRLGHIRILVFDRAKCRPSIIQQRALTRLSLPNLSIEAPLHFSSADHLSLPRDYPSAQGRSIRIIPCVNRRRRSREYGRKRRKMLVRAWQLQVERFSIGRTSNIARSNGSERSFDVIERASSMLPEYSTIVSDSSCLINVEYVRSR